MATRKNPILRTPLPPPSGAARSYVTAGQAARALGIKPASLYSYVSRGLIRSIAQPGERGRLYYREDVERAGKRMGGRAGMPETVESVLTWGQPILHTTITDLLDGGPSYRGRPAIELATSGCSFESVVEWLWREAPEAPNLRWPNPTVPPDFVERVTAAMAGARSPSSLRLMSFATTSLAVSGPASTDMERDSTLADARQIMQLYVASMGLMGVHQRFVASADQPRSLAETFLVGVRGAASPEAVRAVDTAFILCADHELSPSTLSARVAASCGAELRACMHAAIAVHSGSVMGAGCDQSESLLRSASDVAQMHRLMSDLERAGGRIPGYNSRAYPRGDPRARQLLRTAASVGRGADRILELLESVEHRFDLTPSLEVGLIALAAALELPPRMASAIWVLARVAGWVAHIVEQRQTNAVLRPRALYVGRETAR